MPALSLAPPPTIRLLNTSLPLLILSERLAFYPGSCVFKLVSSAAFLAGPLYYLAPSPSPSPSLSPLDWRQWHPYHLRIAAGLLFSAVGDYCLIPARAEYYEKHTGSLAARKERAGDGHGDNDDNDEEEEEEEEEEEGKKPSTSVKVGVCAFAAAHAAYILAFLQDNSSHSSTSTSTSTAAAAAASSSFSRPIFTSTFAAAMLLARWLGVIYPPANGNGERKQHKTTTTNGPQRLLRTNVLNLAIPADMRALVGGYAAIISGMLAVAVSTATATATATAWPYQRALGAAMFVASDLFVAEDMFGRRRRGGAAGRAQRPGWLRPALGFGLYFWAQMVIAGTVGEG
ncbi:YhhN domain-containing protein [Histoplasma capsulatum G186AR]|uniref:YhhN domain-containing protein n=2 Tax=Ajellomyces capsulatus TaxID=5037 RepID=C0P0B8_AJECG|nr:YhhN domain-containing protein [Histoplasma capsulatum G186AR]EEH02934.1 YhhN domain-containing protein [Histoplasma capsulatum G186AR]KAG5296009.1 YhhN domain-containing protein [Histoplasma capsulatum]QSS73992.1 YhhN domain-containing protein [Histoplasma capsulatum G186AR]